jgi:hypothetical protein
MRRALTWIDQAEQVLKLELPIGHVDSNQPDLASVKWAALCIGAFIIESRRQGAAVPILDNRRVVRVWFDARRRRVYGFAIEASYDGGRTFENPLTRYR